MVIRNIDIRKKLESAKFSIVKHKKPIVALGLAFALGSSVSSCLSDKNNMSIVSITNNELPDDFDKYIKKDIPFILKVSPTGCRYADIYKTIDFVKEVVSKYDIKYPILYDVENDVLNSSDYTRANALLAEEFCDKLTANGCYVGLYGSDSSMIKVENELKENGIDSMNLYDKLIVDDGDDIKYSGTYSMRMDKDGKFSCDFDIEKVIEDNKLNDEVNFVDDIIYTVKSGDVLDDIAQDYDIKVVDLAQYNNLLTDGNDNAQDVKVIRPGDKLVIPNKYNSIDSKKVLDKIDVVSIIDDKLPDNFEKYVKDDIPFILKVSPTGCRYADIYKTIDFVKEVVSKYDIKYPILYDVENDVLNSSDYTRANALLAEEFCDKLTANGCYVGLYGSDSSMIKVENELKENGIDSMNLYDKLIVDDGDDIKYSGTYSMRMDKDGKFSCDFDIEKVIELNDLNNKDKFVEDVVYVVEDNNKLEGIASYYNMKTVDLAKYNGLLAYGDDNISDVKDISVGDRLIIPNTYGTDSMEMEFSSNKEEIVSSSENKLDNEEFPSETNNRLVKGIDVSHHNGEIDWETVANADVDYVIIRICDFSKDTLNNGLLENTELDTQFLKNLKGCIDNDIPFGFYYFSRAVTSEEATREANVVLNTLEELFDSATQISYPIYMDVEASAQLELCKDNKFNDCVDAAMKVFSDRGYCGGVYCNVGQVTDVSSELRRKFLRGDDELLEGNNLISYMSAKNYTMWLVNNLSYNNETSIEEFNPASISSVSGLLRGDVDMAQYTEMGTCAGVPSDSVDIDYATGSLEEDIIDSGKNIVKVKKKQ